MDERRRSLRWTKKIRITYSFGLADELFEEAFTQDVSEHGVSLAIKDKPQKGQIIRIKLEFVQDAVPIITDGIVVYVQLEAGKYHVGLDFNNLNDFDRERLRRGIDSVNKETQDGGL